MPAITLVQGRYKDVVYKVFTRLAGSIAEVDELLITPPSGAADIQTDLDRLYFFCKSSDLDVMTQEFKTYQKAIKSAYVGRENEYAQGTLDGREVSHAFSKLEFKHAGEVDGKALENSAMKWQQRKELEFAYVDDDGVSCGLSLLSVPISADSSRMVWEAVLVRHTDASLDKMEVVMMGHPDLVTCGDYDGLSKETDPKPTTDTEKYEAFLKALNSDRVRQKIEPILKQIEPIDEVAELVDRSGSDVIDPSFGGLTLTTAEPPVAVARPSVEARVAPSATPETPSKTRYKIAALVGVLCLLVMIGLILALSGVLAPIGIAIAGTALVGGLATATGVLGGVGLILSGIGFGKWLKTTSASPVSDEVPMSSAPLREEVSAASLGTEKAIDFSGKLTESEGLHGSSLKEQSQKPQEQLQARQDSTPVYRSDSSSEEEKESKNPEERKSPRP